MKNTLLVLFILVLTLGAEAQELFSVGVKGGYTSTRFDMDNYEQRLIHIDNNKYQSGYLAGLYARVKIFKGLSLQPEFYYASKQGEIALSSVNNELVFPDTSFVTEMKSFDLPMLIHMRLMDFEVVNVYAVGGPVLSIVNDSSTDPDLMGYEFDKSNWTIMIGGGVEFGKFFIDARYEWSLSNSATSNESSLYGDMFYNMVTVSLGYRIFGI